MSVLYPRQKPGSYGVQRVYISTEKIGTITSASTDTFRFPTPYRKCYIQRISAQAQTPPAVTTGTSTATVKIFRANGGSSVTVSSGLDLETLTANKAKAFTIPTTTTDAQRILVNDSTNGGDTLYVELVNGTTIATQPVALYIVVELLVLE